MALFTSDAVLAPQLPSPVAGEIDAGVAEAVQFAVADVNENNAELVDYTEFMEYLHAQGEWEYPKGESTGLW